MLTFGQIQEFSPENETIGAYLERVELYFQAHGVATHCQFEAHLSPALWDRLVCSLRNEATQKHLLSKSELTLQQAVEIAQSMEAAECNTQQLKWVLLFIVGFYCSTEKECYRCGRKNYL